MFGFGHGPELIIILVIGLIVLGPGKIPEIAQMLGKGIRELRQASADLQKTFDVNELMNPTPAPPAPPPVEAAPASTFAAETIAPPGLAAKPKRTRKPKSVGVSPAFETHLADAPAVAADDVPSQTPELTETAPPAKPKARRRPSKKLTEPVSLDTPA